MDLFVDYVPAPTLEEYLVINRASLSLPSKIFILIMILRGVRFIHGFEITHLDLKPQNILLLKNMVPKIIDFGESYHAKVCKEEFVPGFSHPYGAPECYYPTNLEIFGPHNDVFSLGIISF
jgi:serine/threonine protein kinase